MASPTSHTRHGVFVHDLTQRGRGRYSFWIHTLSPPPEYIFLNSVPRVERPWSCTFVQSCGGSRARLPAVARRNRVEAYGNCLPSTHRSESHRWSFTSAQRSESQRWVTGRLLHVRQHGTNPECADQSREDEHAGRDPNFHCRPDTAQSTVCASECEFGGWPAHSSAAVRLCAVLASLTWWTGFYPLLSARRR